MTRVSQGDRGGCDDEASGGTSCDDEAAEGGCCSAAADAAAASHATSRRSTPLGVVCRTGKPSRSRTPETIKMMIK